MIKVTEGKTGHVGCGRGSDNFVHVVTAAELGRVREWWKTLEERGQTRGYLIWEGSKSVKGVPNFAIK